MATISGLHHVSVPASDVVRSSDWYERVFGFTRVLIREEEEGVTAVLLEHPTGVMLSLHKAPELIKAWRSAALGPSVLSFRVAARSDLDSWNARLSELGVEHSRPRPAHVGWALDLRDPDGLALQLHTREEISADDV